MAKKNETALQRTDTTYSQRFTSMVMREFSDISGKVSLDPYQQRLAQNLFVAIDNQLHNLEVKRLDRGGQGNAMTWANVNTAKLAVDAVHRIELGLDALIPNHIHPIPYWNKRLAKYDMDLRVGYVGKDFYRRQMAVETPKDIIYELVHKTDEFQPIKKTFGNDVETYRFTIVNPFSRGEVIGGFGYIMYDDPTQNKLVMVSKEDFDKSRRKAQSDQFWKEYEREMQHKTLVHRVTSVLVVDPRKVNASFLAVETEEMIDMNEREIGDSANQDFIDISPEPEEPPPSEPKPAKEKPATRKASPKKDEEPPPPEPPDEEHGEPMMEEDSSSGVWLRCPANINKDKPEKSIDECKLCTRRSACDAYMGWRIDEDRKKAGKPGF